MTLNVGDAAPDFKLKGNDDKEHALSDYKGKPVVLIFYPLDFSPVCTNEHACFVEDMGKFNDLDAQVFGVSVDSAWAHKAFAKQMNIGYPLLADFHPKGDVAKKYGVYLEEKGIAGRTTFVIDRAGKIAAVHAVDVPTVPETDPVLKALEALK